MNILAIPGSLRDNSYNRLLIDAAEELAPDGVDVTTFSIGDIPLYDQDLDRQPEPEPVARFRQAIRDADALLLATPEYNYSVPGVLKNAIDWASRPYGNNPFNEKPVAIMSASIGMLGGARAQYHLRQMFVFLNMYPINGPEVMVPFAQDKFDSQGKLIDENTKKFLSTLLENLVNWTRKLVK